MMPPRELITADGILPALKAPGKKQALLEMSERAAELSGLNAREIFDALLQRERLGSTGVGNGIAIPHGKLEKAHRLFGVFARLDRPIDFEAIDGQPVDLIFLLLAPEAAGADHLHALATVSRLLRDAKLTEQLRGAKDAAAIYRILTEAEVVQAA